MALTTDRNDPDLGYGIDIEPGPQMLKYLVLSEDELIKGFIRPVRDEYYHIKCNTRTIMNLAIAETYARNPKFYGATYCMKCKMHLSVEEFVWVENNNITDIKVGE